MVDCPINPNGMIAENDDVLTEILLWLPSKSLIRFKMVCKHWLSLISSYHFSSLHILRHRRRCSPEPSLLLHLEDTLKYFYLHPSVGSANLVPYVFPTTLTDIAVLSSSNGLLLLQCRDAENATEVCHIYNPTTKQFRRILLNVNDRRSLVLGLNLAFDPLKSPYYKIVCVRGNKRSSKRRRRQQIEVYESDTHTWKLCGNPFVAPADMEFQRGVYWNDGIYWRRSFENTGMYFDFNKNTVEGFARYAVPGDTGIYMCIEHFKESKGYLHLIAHFVDRKSVAILELSSEYSQWLLKYHDNLDQAPEPFCVLSINREDNEEDITLVLHEPGKIMSYGFHEKNLKEVIDFREEAFYEEGSLQFFSRSTFHFLEILVPV